MQRLSLEVQSHWSGWLPLYSYRLSLGIYLSFLCISFPGHLNSEMDWGYEVLDSDSLFAEGREGELDQSPYESFIV